jgi:hypothetical protein
MADTADAGPSLPGEDGPLDPEQRPHLAPITDAEALGVARRHARKAIKDGRRRTAMAVPDELPPPDAPPIMTAWRLPPRLLLRAKAKAELEDRTTLTRVLIDALAAYAASSPGAVVQYRAVAGGTSATPAGPARSVPDVTKRSRKDTPDVGAE